MLTLAASRLTHFNDAKKHSPLATKTYCSVELTFSVNSRSSLSKQFLAFSNAKSLVKRLRFGRCVLRCSSIILLLFGVLAVCWQRMEWAKILYQFVTFQLSYVRCILSDCSFAERGWLQIGCLVISSLVTSSSWLFLLLWNFIGG